MKKVTGIGGIFFKSANPAATREWYAQHLGLHASPYGTAVFEWKTAGEGTTAYTIWSPFKAETDYFQPSESSFMINFRVADLKSLLEELKAAGVEVVGEMQEFDYGKFGWVIDPDGNKIELWEPVDAAFGKQDFTIY